MTTKAAFSAEEWKAVLEGPPTAGMIVITAARGGMFRESIAMSKAYAEARAQHGESELLDSGICGTRSRWSRPRPRPGNSMATGASCWPWRARSRPRTGRKGKA